MSADGIQRIPDGSRTGDVPFRPVPSRSVAFRPVPPRAPWRVRHSGRIGSSDGLRPLGAAPAPSPRWQQRHLPSLREMRTFPAVILGIKFERVIGGWRDGEGWGWDGGKRERAGSIRSRRWRVPGGARMQMSWPLLTRHQFNPVK